MESWVPLLEIFLKSPTPESEASVWLQQKQQQRSSITSSSASTPPITTSSFLSFLSKPLNASDTRRIMFVQTLPDMVQSRILSFLAFERQRFCKHELSALARGLLMEKERLDFWVKRAARNLLDAVSESTNEWISGLSLDSGEEMLDEEFEALPSWLNDAAASSTEMFLPFLPMSPDELKAMELMGSHESEERFLCQVGENGGDNIKEDAKGMEIDQPGNAPLNQDIQEMATGLRARVVMTFESSSKAVELANEVRGLCLERGRDSFAVLALIEPWKADDEVASVLITHLSNGSEDELSWPSQVLCSVILPKMLVLEEPASGVLVTAMVTYCKLYQRAAEYSLLYPLVMKRGGINNPICDVITRIVKECLHLAHVSAFCQKLLCEREDDKRYLCLPCHQCLISNELVWTESLFSLFHNVLNLKVHLTQDCVDQLALQVGKLAQRFSKSLKFGNFLLCFITKCSLLLKSHKILLTEAVEQTNTFVTKSILSKLASL